MRVIARKTLKDFWLSHADAEQPLKAWFAEASAAKWNSFKDIKRSYRSADVLPGNRVVFDIKGNRCRLIVKIHCDTGIAFVRFIGTHAACEKIDAISI